MKTIFALSMVFVMLGAWVQPLTAQTTALTVNGPLNVADPVAFTFPYTGTLYKTDTTYTASIENTRLSPIYDWSHYVSYSNDSVKITYKLQGYYNYIGQWITLKTLCTDSLKNTYYVTRDTLQYNPDLIRIKMYGGAVASGGTVANGKLTTVKGELKFIPKTH